MNIDWENLPMREPLAALLNREPFQPFRIHMTGGYTRELRQRECARLDKSTIAIGVWDRSAAPPHFDERCILAVYHIARLETLCSDEPTIVPAQSHLNQEKTNS